MTSDELAVLAHAVGCSNRPSCECGMIEACAPKVAALLERLHKTDGMANEINILTREIRAMSACEKCVSAGASPVVRGTCTRCHEYPAAFHEGVLLGLCRLCLENDKIGTEAALAIAQRNCPRELVEPFATAHYREVYPGERRMEATFAPSDVERLRAWWYGNGR
mgnify:CR=1 FL=1